MHQTDAHENAIYSGWSLFFSPALFARCVRGRERQREWIGNNYGIMQILHFAHI